MPEFELLHIGKSSGGWCFALHSIPGFATSLEEWKPWFFLYPIVNEYGVPKTPEEMIMTITCRVSPGNRVIDAEYLRENHATLGPHGLLRHAYRDAIPGVGDETWDMITGDFS
jgi:hypothetical protein